MSPPEVAIILVKSELPVMSFHVLTPLGLFNSTQAQVDANVLKVPINIFWFVATAANFVKSVEEHIPVQSLPVKAGPIVVQLVGKLLVHHIPVVDVATM